MKHSLSLLSLLLITLLAACNDIALPEEVTEEIPEESTELKGTVYILSRERANQQEMFRSTNTKTGEKIEYSLETFNLNSPFYDPHTGGLGFVNADKKFRLINPINGEEIRSFDLDHAFGATVMDYEAYEMIGVRGFAQNDLRIARYNLENGDLISDHPLELDTYTMCVQYYSQVKKEYYVILPTGVVVIDPSTGKTVRELPIDLGWDQVYYDEKTHTFSRIHYPETGDPFLEHINAEDGSSVSRVRVSGLSPRTCFFNFDYLSPDFIMVSHPSEVLYLNSETAEVKETFTVNNDVLPFMIWRGQ